MIVPLTVQQTMALLGPSFVATFQAEMDAIVAPLATQPCEPFLTRDLARTTSSKTLLRTDS